MVTAKKTTKAKTTKSVKKASAKSVAKTSVKAAAPAKKKGFLANLFDKADKKMEEKSNECGCGCCCGTPKKKTAKKGGCC